MGLKVRAWSSPPRTPRPGVHCEVSDGAVILRGVTGLRYSKPPRVDVQLAFRLARFETLVQEEAKRAFGRPVVQIDHLGSTVCRGVAGAPSVTSQHAVGRALDVSAFVLSGGRKVSVERHFVRGGAPTRTAEGAFLRSVVERTLSERVFSSILTPDYDRRHHNHLHVDIGQRWSWLRSLVS